MGDSAQETDSCCVWSTDSPLFIKPAGSLPLSQTPANGLSLLCQFSHVLLPIFYLILEYYPFTVLCLPSLPNCLPVMILKQNMSVLNSLFLWVFSVVRYIEAGKYQFDICKALKDQQYETALK
jgi:uncharacterized membrane protein